MKFEVKTQNHDLAKPIFSTCLIFLIIFIMIIFSNFSFKFGKISRYYEINYLCKLLKIEPSASNFKKLSKLTKQTSKQKLWDLCSEIVK